MSDDIKNTSPYDEEGYPLGSKRDDPLTDLMLILSGEKALLQEQAFRNKTDYTEEMREVLKEQSISSFFPENFTVTRGDSSIVGYRYRMDFEYRKDGQRYGFRVDMVGKDIEDFNAQLPYTLKLLVLTAIRYHRYTEGKE